MVPNVAPAPSRVSHPVQMDDNNVLMGKFTAAISANAPYLKNVELAKPSGWSRNIAAPRYHELDYSFQNYSNIWKSELP